MEELQNKVEPAGQLQNKFVRQLKFNVSSCEIGEKVSKSFKQRFKDSFQFSQCPLVIFGAIN